MEDTNSLAVESLINAGIAMGQPKTDQDSNQHMIVPEGYKIQRVSERAKPPVYKKAKVLFSRAKSFVQYVNEHKQPNTVIFAEDDNARFTAIMDYHNAGKSGEPDHMFHHARYNAPVSREWDRWNGHSDGYDFGQVEFSHFIEENMADIVDPAGADILEIATDLRAKRNVSFVSAERLQDGSQQFQYIEETESETTKSGLIVPDHFVIGIPVFNGGDPYRIKVMLRYRIDDSKKLVFKMDMHRADYVFDEAFDRIVEEIEKATETEALFGSCVGTYCV